MQLTRSSLSIVIPCLKVNDINIFTCISSILAQKFSGILEVLLIGDITPQHPYFINTNTSKGLLVAKINRKQLNVKFISNPFKIAEAAKLIGIKESTRDFILFMDMDNEIPAKDQYYLQEMVIALENNPNALGVESNYLAPPDFRMYSFCKYLTSCLHISDPLSWFIAKHPKENEENYYVDGMLVEHFKVDLGYPQGANCFLYRNSDLKTLTAFEDTAVCNMLKLKYDSFLRLYGRGIYHYIIMDGIMEFIAKRRRQVFHNLSIKSSDVNWIKYGNSTWLGIIYCLTIVGPLYHTFKNVRKSIYWLWHPIACLASVFGAFLGVWTYFRCAANYADRNYEFESSLQP